MDPVLSFIDAINIGMSYLVLVLFLLALAAFVVWYTTKRIRSDKKKREGPGKGIFLGILALIEAIVFALVIIGFPNLLTNLYDQYRQARFGAFAFLSESVQEAFHWITPAYIFRWILLFILIPSIIYTMFKKYRGEYAFVVILIILTIALFGWWYDHWIGILLISLPIYGLLIHLIYRLAQVVIPTSDPDSKEERKQKFKVLLFYILGVQYPFWVAKSSAAREIETRIPGDYFFGAFEPSTVWTHSHQVAAISAGIEFDQVDGPGTIFLKTYNRPVAIVDLRTQIRTSEVDTTTKDGVSIKAVVFTSFAIDKEDWPKKSWKTEDIKRLPSDIRANPLMENGLRLDKKIGSYPYSTARVKSVLSTVGIHSSYLSDDGGTIYWDQWALAEIENAARQVVSQRTLSELWHPVMNGPSITALDEIAVNIREIIEPRMRRMGINLFGARIVNFVIDKDSAIRKQQIDSWKALWTQKITTLESEAQTIYKEEIEKAHAYAKSAILDVIAEGIKKARQEHPDLPRHVIAVYYIHAIEEYIQRRPDGDESKEAKDRVEQIKNFLLYNQQ